MTLQNTLLPELDREIATTRRVLERVPAGKFDWSPHATSRTIGALAAHIAQIPHRAMLALTVDTLDLKSPEAVAAVSHPPATPAELVERWDKHVAEIRAALDAVTETQLGQSFTLKAGEATIFTLPRPVAMRNFFLRHVIHHRGQLSVYLRILGVPVPSIYGPSADEK